MCYILNYWFDINFQREKLYLFIYLLIFSGKFIEDVRKRRRIELASDIKRMQKLVAYPTFRSMNIISPELVGIENYISSIKLNKPIYIGQTILDLSKWIMYDLHYNYIDLI